MSTVYPQPTSGGGESTPPTVGALVFGGFSPSGTYQHNGTITSGVYVVYAYGSSTSNARVYSIDSNSTYTVKPNEKQVIGFNSNELNFIISNPIDVSTSGILSNRKRRISTFTSQPFNGGIIYNPTSATQKFVGFTESASIFSSDGVNWSSSTGAGGGTINDSAYFKGLYIAGSSGGVIRTSTNLVTWTTRTSQFGISAIRGIATNNNVVVAVGANGLISSSTDGITWTAQSAGVGTSTLNAVAFGNGLFVAVGDGGAVSYSTNGTSWTGTTNSTTSMRSITYGNGIFVAGTTNGWISTSMDGTGWTAGVSGFGTSQVFKLAFVNNSYIGSTSNGNIRMSTDAITWGAATKIPEIAGDVIGLKTVGNAIFIMGSNTNEAVSILPEAGSFFVYQATGSVL